MKKVVILVMVVLFIALLPAVALASDGSTVYQMSVEEIIARLALAVGVFLAMWMIAIVIERLVEIAKAKMAPRKLPNGVWFLITSAIGILICIPSGLNMLAFLGLGGGMLVAVICEVLTGFCIGAGSGVVHSLQTKMNEVKSFAESAQALDVEFGEDEDIHDTSGGGTDE